MPVLPAARLLAELESHGQALAVAARELDRPVAGLEWCVREVVVHTGAVHRWAADIVRRRLPANETGGSRAFHPDPAVPDADLGSWYLAALADLVDVLRAAPDDLEAWTFARGLPARHFWIRRQAHETAIHRVDVAGAAVEVSPDFAQDGIDELAVGFARQRAFATAEAGTLALAAADGPSWIIRFGGERIDAAPADRSENADATVAGTSAELYRWLWNRPSAVTVDGDPDVVALWRRVRI